MLQSVDAILAIDSAFDHTAHSLFTVDIQADKVAAQWRRGELTAVQAMKRLGMSKATFYRKMKC